MAGIKAHCTTVSMTPVAVGNPIHGEIVWGEEVGVGVGRRCNGSGSGKMKDWEWEGEGVGVES